MEARPSAISAQRMRVDALDCRTDGEPILPSHCVRHVAATISFRRQFWDAPACDRVSAASVLANESVDARSSGDRG